MERGKDPSAVGTKWPNKIQTLTTLIEGQHGSCAHENGEQRRRQRESRSCSNEAISSTLVCLAKQETEASPRNEGRTDKDENK